MGADRQHAGDNAERPPVENKQRQGARLMTSDEKIDKAIGMIDVIATEVTKNGASIEQMHGSLEHIRISLDETQATLGSFVVESRVWFARIAGDST